MSDPGAAAARLLRALLGTGVLLLLGGLALAGRRWGAWLQLAGIGCVMVGPFAVLLMVAARERRTAWYAVGTILLTVAGFLLAR